MIKIGVSACLDDFVDHCVDFQIADWFEAVSWFKTGCLQKRDRKITGFVQDQAVVVCSELDRLCDVKTCED